MIETIKKYFSFKYLSELRNKYNVFVDLKPVFKKYQQCDSQLNS